MQDIVRSAGSTNGAAIHLTGGQLKKILVHEGLLYDWGAVALALAAAMGALTGSVLGNMFWFFDYRFTMTPILLLLLVSALLGCLVPLAVYRSVSCLTIVERSRWAER